VTTVGAKVAHRGIRFWHWGVTLSAFATVAIVGLL
jgi:hypothetical protein